MTSATAGHAVDIEVPLEGARALYLVVDDAADGYRCDWADWIEPRLVGPQGEQRLTDLDWESATAEWGRVHKQRNAAGGPLRVAGQSIRDGIGTHARSVIHFRLPEGYTHFRARGGIDNGGTDQGGNAASVRFAVYTEPPPEKSERDAGGGPNREPEAAVSNLNVHPELDVALFAAEPMLLSPSNIDVDHRGRVWVCEIVNYRVHHGRRAAGDRILILEDTDGDGRADHQKVFYQGRDVDSAHGVCVLGNRVIVSAGSQVLCFTDDNGDDRPDRKDVWFSGISGVQHDHGIHAFMFGPDGKLYFNFGNAGEQICDAQGHPIVDMAGNRVAETMKPYQQGMVFRCNLDLSCFETLAWNFRNNWMVAVDSFGTIWQSDNDDDGNRGVRINYVMEFGNYGYRDEFTGAGWQTPRIGMSDDIANRHWHQNDPGVVPNVLHTGAGSPTGIAVYEGNALPEAFRGQLIHCDAGPSVTRAYQITDVGAGYAGHIVNLLEGTRDPWFRPSDVKVAPDGSLIVADWFDPGVGGHQMGDVDRGRLFRVTAKASSSGDSTGGPRYVMPRFDFSTPQGAVDALQNPNNAVRYLAWQSLHRSGAQAAEALEQLAARGEPHDRARAYWLLGKIPGRGRNYVEQAAREPDARLRIVALRLARQIDELDPLSLVERLADDSSPQVRRECALALRGSDDPRAVDLWTRLALAHDGQDRWYLEALGIGAEGQWDRYLAAWLERVGPAWNAAPGREIVWRSRAVQTSELLRQLIEDAATPAAEIPRYLRALDFQPESARVAALERLAFHCSLPQGQRRELVQTQALYRMPAELLRNNVPRQQQLDRVLDSLAGTSEFIELVQRFGLQHRFDQVLQLAAERPTDATGIDAVRMLLAADQQTRLAEWIRQHPDQGQLAMIALLGRSADNRALPLLKQIMLDVNASPETRRAALQSLARLRAGAEFLLDQSQAQSLPVELMHAVAADLHQVPWDDLRARALELFPITPSKDNKSLRPLRELAELRGDVAKGEVVYRTGGTCIKCHVANGQGTAVGPELSEIGDKLSREAMIESIVYPSAGISHSFESYAVELEDGNIVSGLLVSQTDEAITLKSSEGIERRFARGDVAHFTRQPLSLMPADLHQNLTEAELIDLVEYLLTLKKP